MKLQIGSHSNFEVREALYHYECKDSFTIMYISDLHLNGKSLPMVEKLIATIIHLNPTIIILGGDYVDSKKGFGYFEALCLFLCERENVFAILGNHDIWFGIKKFEAILKKTKINYLCKTIKTIYINSTPIEISNNIKEHLNNNCFSILALHKPVNVFNLATKFNVAFAGHLHGCQFVFWQNKHGLFPGKWFYKWNILKKQLNNSLFLISKGLGDTLPIRYNCKKDIIFVTVKNTKL